MTSTKDILIIPALILVLFMGVPYFISYGFGEIQKKIDQEGERLRNQSNETLYEYKVISVEHKTHWIFGGDYFKIIYLDSNNTVLIKEFEPNDGLRFVPSNESKFVVENPEYNGHPLRYTLYGDIK